MTRIDDAVYDVESVIGLETKRPLTAGTIVSKAMLAKPFVVRSGDNVAIVSRSGTIVVQVAGQAMQGGAVGDVIRVRNRIISFIFAQLKILRIFFSNNSRSL